MYHDTLSSLPCTTPFLGGPQLTDVCSASNGELFLALLNLFVATNPTIGEPCQRVHSPRIPDISYDFIVVGGKRINEINKEKLFDQKVCVQVELRGRWWLED